MDLFSCKGLVCLVTGGNRGIGLGMAQALAQAGAQVVIWGSNKANNDKAVAQIAGAVAQVVDVANEEAVQQGFAELLAQHKKVDAVFANAGIGAWGGTFAEMNTDVYRKVLAVNLDGAFFTLRAAAKAMIAQGNGGSLVGIASLAAVEGAARNQHYAATKGAVTSMIRAIAVEHARYNIRANSILPGWIATDMTQGMQDDDGFAKKVLPRVPMRRWGTPEDFGGIAVYLASKASAFHTGDEFVVDGGYRIF